MPGPELTVKQLLGPGEYNVCNYKVIGCSVSHSRRNSHFISQNETGLWWFYVGAYAASPCRKRADVPASFVGMELPGFIKT